MAEYIEREVAIKLIAEDRVELTPTHLAIGNAVGGYTIEQVFDSINQACDRHIEFIKSVPFADVQPVTRCKDCVYRPYFEPSDSKSVSDLVFPDCRFNPCPCRVEDIWYSWMPDDDWFCAYGKRKDGGT